MSTPPRTLADLERLPAFALLRCRRSAWAGLALGAQFTLLGLLVCVSVAPATGPGTVLGYQLGLVVPGAGHAVAFAFTVAFVLWSSSRAVRTALSRPDVTMLRPSTGALPIYGALTGHQLVATIDAVAAEMKVGPIHAIAVEDHFIPNAMTARVPGLGSVVILHSNLLHLLSPGEVRSVVAHEVAHVRAADSVIALLGALPRAATAVTAAWVLFHVAEGILAPPTLATLLARCTFALLAWTGFNFARGAIALMSRRAGRIAEVIADLRAAAVCGYEAHLNALLRIGERSEALANFSQGIRGVLEAMGQKGADVELYPLLAQLPTRMVDARQAAMAAPYAFVKHQLEAMRKGLGLALDDHQIRDLARGAARTYWAGAKQPPGGPPEEVLPWREFDADQSNALDAAEAERLVAELKSDSKRLLFRTLSAGAGAGDSHPTMRDRILAVHAYFGPRAPG